MTEIGVAEIGDLIEGSRLGVLSAGNTYPDVVETWVERLLQERGPVPLLGVGEVAAGFAPDDLAVTIGMVGSATAMLEIPPSGEEPVLVAHELERVVGRRFAAVAPLNAAGPNALIAVVAASLLGVPLLDCDGMGRVFPLIDQTSYVLHGLSPAPLAAIGPWGDLITLTSPHRRAESVVRAAVTAAGGWMIFAMYPAPVRELAAAGIPGQVTSRMTSGALTVAGPDSLGERLARQLGGRVLGRGEVVDISEHPDVGLDGRRQPGLPMSIVVRDLEDSAGDVRLEIRNEVVLATRDGSIAAMAPDTICVLDPFRGSTVDPLDLKEGEVIEVLVLPVHETWQSEEALRLVNPSTFGVPLGGGSQT